MMTKHQYTAAIVRGILTAADVNLRRGSKREIEEFICVALAKADAQWEAFAREQNESAAARQTDAEKTLRAFALMQVAKKTF